MRNSFFFAAALWASLLVQAQPSDSWSNLPAAPDDRFSNPKSKLYAGPNGWHNFGEVRAEVANAAKTGYAFKTGFEFLETPKAFVFASNNMLRNLMLDFRTDAPAPGSYTLAAKPQPGQKKVAVSFADVAGGKILEWTSAEGGGSVQVSQVNGYRYFKARDLLLKPSGLHNAGELAKPLRLGLEGALAPK